MLAAQASSTTAHPSSSGHMGMLRYSSTMSTREQAEHHDEFVTFGAGQILRVGVMKGGSSFIASECDPQGREESRCGITNVVANPKDNCCGTRSWD
jgi:hypothetical protein